MRIGILRPIPQFSFSMNVYADGLVSGLRAIQPDWEIVELAPKLSYSQDNAVLRGIDRYYQRYWRYPQKLQQLAADFDLFHIIDHSDGHLLYALKNLPLPVIITCHDLINLAQPESFQGRSLIPSISLKSWQYAVAGMQHAERIVAVSNHTAQDITQYLSISESKIVTIPNAVDAQFQTITPADIDSFRTSKNLTPQDFCVLNVGSNNLRKNITTIIRAIATLKSQNVPVHFWKAGADFNDEQKQLIAEHNLGDCVTYLGKPSPQELIQVYNAADVLLAPSTYEGFGLTILEAMACGTPVITANVTSLPEVAGDAAILVAPQDLSGIVTALSRLYAELELRQSLATKGLTRVQEFSWSKTASKVTQVYQQALAQAEAI